MKFINTINNKCKIDLLIIFVLYSISFFLLLINFGVFWDDWVLYNMSPTIILDTFNQAGSVWVGYFHNFLLSIGNSITSYRILTFTAYFLSAVFLYFILYTIDEIDRFDRLLIVIFFAILPFNSARIALINTPSAFFHFLFWLGFLFLSLYLKDKKKVLRIIALIFFFLSFSLSSLLVFYAIVILYIAYFEFYRPSSNTSIIKKFVKYSDFIILPVIYWVIKTVCFKPYGLYAGYNTLTLEKLYGVPELLRLSFVTSFIEPLKQSFKINSTISLIILGIVIFFLLKNKYSQKADDKRFLFFYFGWFLFFLAVFPYNAVGQIPSLGDWNSRFQILLPLSVSLILIYGIRLFIPTERIQKLTYSLLISSFLLSNISYYIDFQKDWYKQVSLIENFKNSEIMKENTSIQFDDKIKDLNANQRIYRYYEYAGQMKLAFGEETRGYDYSLKLSPALYGHYNMKDYKMIKAQYIVEIHGNKQIGTQDLIRLKYLELFKTNEFKEKTREFTSLRYKKITQ